VVACGGRTPTDIDTVAGASASSGAGAGASSGAGAGASSGEGASSGTGSGAGPGSGEGSDAGDEGADDAALFYTRYDARPALFEATYLSEGMMLPTIAFQCLQSLRLPVGPNGLPDCYVVVDRPLGSETLADCQKCDDVPGLVPFVPSLPLNQLGDRLTNQSCLCTVTPLVNAKCPDFDNASASWCYVGSATAAMNGNHGAGEACAEDDGGIIAFSQEVGMAGQVYVACFPLASP
jgi:hypothetical protein